MKLRVNAKLVIKKPSKPVRRVILRASAKVKATIDLMTRSGPTPSTPTIMAKVKAIVKTCMTPRVRKLYPVNRIVATVVAKVKATVKIIGGGRPGKRCRYPRKTLSRKIRRVLRKLRTRRPHRCIPRKFTWSMFKSLLSDVARALRRIDPDDISRSTVKMTIKKTIQRWRLSAKRKQDF